MLNFPVSFVGESQATSGIKSSWKTTASTYESVCSIPPEFEGAGGSFSPEDYFLLALQNCFVATFKVYAEYSRLAFNDLVTSSELVVDKDDSGKPVMNSLILNIALDGIVDEKKALLLVNKTLANGYILQSVKTTIKPQITINGEARS